ncbi:MAG: hypothetical protein A3E31_09830 [Candidatus Rokubacteria bacterium RIFCSPHIGHO2_12_FULL_73_22]|nr:MAG: hypothetical protein A3E31_09830 [Candidatus Rokubacteria bacterium RIFCSPHIGHO2_12_FULL_73_22]OGL10728.1 MAG: hypothetical protein A3I14_13975 [Candidatus Rokubacteria bacterium RIFCSPLOWO2_02_FULL_73_56]OGL20979.1 MAG: hypothetical protein A3G44_09085 [Candidatus Rokubacteria bacterium RIFCSPLOWO2_12_FULL_73_47]
MPPWFQALLSLALLALLVALVAAVLALRRLALRAEAVLAIAEQELRPLVAQTHALLEEARGLTRQATGEVERIRAVTDRVGDVAHGVARVLTAVSGFTRAGQLVGLAVGLRRGVDVFLQRIRRHEGDDHE